MKTHNQVLEDLRQAESPALERLASLAANELLTRPLGEVLDADFVAAQAAAVLQSLARPTTREAIAKRVDEGIQTHTTTTSCMREHVPGEALDPLRELLGRPLHVSEELTHKLIDQGVVHRLLADVLESALKRFMRRARRVDDKLKAVDERLGGFGRRARGLFGNVASELASAVGEELEHSVEARIKEFVHQGTSEMLKVAARRIADPAQAAAWGEFRVAVLELLIDTPIADLATEAQAQEPGAATSELLAALGATAQSEGFQDAVASAVRRAQQEVGDGTLAAWLDELELRELWGEATTGPLADQLRHVVGSEAFGSWWEQQFAD
ncbi:MAG: hypothetical protein KC912_00365 [Proteobacteria bacterium]|nr:hypothetical protein [Pseudomonadota bacterium]